MERATEMIDRRSALLGAILCIAAASASRAGIEDMINEVINKEKQIDPGRDVRGPFTQVLQAGCQLNEALVAAVAGNVRPLRDALTAASANLRKAAGDLQSAAKDGRYKRLITPKGIKLTSESGAGRASNIFNGQDLVLTIADMAQETAQLLSLMLERDASFGTLSTAIAMTIDMNTLVVAFYSSTVG